MLSDGVSASRCPARRKRGSLRVCLSIKPSARGSACSLAWPGSPTTPSSTTKRCTQAVSTSSAAAGGAPTTTSASRIFKGGNTDVKHSNVFEAYYRASINEYLAISVDAQYVDDSLDEVDPKQRNPVGWIFGLRATAEL